MKHKVHKWGGGGGNILSIHDCIESPIRHPNQKNELFHEKIINFSWKNDMLRIA